MGLEEGVRRRREGVGGAENDGETRRRRERKLTRLSLSSIPFIGRSLENLNRRSRFGNLRLSPFQECSTRSRRLLRLRVRT